ncbi:hypothetical protein [Pseudoflavonifractor sp. 60]|uniref:hypothetical protein n=1 Tax=Pseudoflavonifractor sp. 60 TaxID=2304576 RepID=UPI001370C784|nr:hypothetical protein [Pseudoflavonifractor sp. 60]
MVESAVNVHQYLFRKVILEVLNGLQGAFGQRRYFAASRISQQAGEQVCTVVPQGIIGCRRIIHDIQQEASGSPAGTVVKELRKRLNLGQQSVVLLISKVSKSPFLAFWTNRTAGFSM